MSSTPCFFALKRQGVALLRGRAEHLLLENGRAVGVMVGGEPVPAGAVVIATGGLSYPATGSTGDGYWLAEEAGHTIRLPPPLPWSPWTEKGDTCAQMQGLYP